MSPLCIGRTVAHFPQITFTCEPFPGFTVQPRRFRMRSTSAAVMRLYPRQRGHDVKALARRCRRAGSRDDSPNHVLDLHRHLERARVARDPAHEAEVVSLRDLHAMPELLRASVRAGRAKD